VRDETSKMLDAFENNVCLGDTLAIAIEMVLAASRPKLLSCIAQTQC
jgi:hypothetical protein